MNQERDLPLTVFKPHVQIYAIVEVEVDDYELIGHGFLSIITDQIQDQTVHYLEVQSVKDSQVMLRSRLRLCNNYEKQRGSVIVWNDSEHRGHYDLAVSFESNKQCDIFWRLICEKIGKNYLQISGREALELPNENNLPYILDKTKTAKDLVQYNLLNSHAFTNALGQLFRNYHNKNNKMGMGMIARIIKSIFSNLDYQMMHALFQDNTFALILDVQKFLLEIDFPKCWAEKLKFRSIIPLSTQINQKIHIIHRLNFYRQNILDLMRENYLEHMIVMTQVEYNKEIILHLTKDNILEDLVALPFPTQTQNQHTQPPRKDIGQEDTSLSQTEEMKRQKFSQRKLQFLLEALIMSKQIQDQNARLRFIDKIYRSGSLQMASDFLDRGIVKSLDFLICLAQSSPNKLVEYLKLKYREQPADNLHIKLSKKYCVGSEEMQNSILEVVKYIAQSFKNKENLDFFIGTFFASVFGCCKDMKAVLAVVSQIQNVLQNIEPLMMQAIRSKVFQRIVPFLRSQRQQKSTDLRSIKILKRVLLENADSSWSFKKIFLDQINQQFIKTGFFQYCMLTLLKNMRFNNIICSSMLENIKIVSQINRFTPYHSYIQQNYRETEVLAKYIPKILEVKEEKKQILGQDGQPLSHQRALEQEQQEAYFMSEMQEEPNSNAMIEQANDQLQNLRRMRREISAEQMEREEAEYYSQPKKKVKTDIAAEPELKIQLELPFDDLEGEK